MLKLSSKIIPKWRLITLSILGGLSIGFTLFASPMLFMLPPDRPGCDTPIRWSLGTVDDRFPLSHKEFRVTAFEAEKMWEDAIGKELFILDNSASFQVRTLFDERQKMTYAGEELDKNITEYEKNSESIRKQYESLEAQYKNQKATYDILTSGFERDASAYEKETSKWNKSGGAPADIYADLENERQSLKKRADELNALNDSLNNLIKKINTLADKFNIQTNTLNTEIETFQEKYGESTPFIQGLYDPNKNNITIFQFQDQLDMRLVLAHEFGHALGIDGHVSNPSSLMYYLMDQQDIRNPEISQEDIDAYDLACPERKFSKKEQLIQYIILTQWDKMNPLGVIAIFR